jgi:hypothetical protein
VRIFDFVSDWWISMLAPPGYAKMTSTPSRSSASTIMSRPNMAAPISARFAVDLTARGVVADFLGGVVLLMMLLGCGGRRRLTKNPRPFPAVGFC